MAKKIPDKIWGIGVNLNGAWCYEPVRLTYHDDLDEWYDKHGNLCVKKLGLDHNDSHLTTFASVNKQEVEIFIAGAKAIVKAARNIAWMPGDDEE